MTTSIDYTYTSGSVAPPLQLNIVGLSPGFIKKSGIALGGGLRGFIPQPLNDTDVSSEVVDTRVVLKQAWNTNYNSQLKSAGYNYPVLSSFRAVNNAGDLLSRPNYACGGSSQVSQSRPGLYGLRKSIGHVNKNCDNATVPSATCNVKYVYDSSDFSRYLKQKAIVKNYNNLTNGGNSYNAQQSAIRAIRRY
jgi:hypothetical protein